MASINRTKVKVMLGVIPLMALPTALFAYPLHGLHPLAWIVFFAGIGAIALWLIIGAAIHAVGMVNNLRSTPTEG